MKKPLALIIMDGFGLRKETEGNAIAAAKHPNLDRLWATCPHTQIGASGLDVGLPDGQMGNSEVGHTNMGAGRIVYQELTRITKSIEEGEYLTNPALVHAMENAKKPGAALHLMGLLSDGGVHSHIRHLFGLLYPDILRKSLVQRIRNFLRRHPAGRVKHSDIPQCMHTGICPAGTDDLNRLPQQIGQTPVQFAFDGDPVILDLPAVIIRTVVGHGQADTLCCFFQLCSLFRFHCVSPAFSLIICSLSYVFCPVFSRPFSISPAATATTAFYGRNDRRPTTMLITIYAAIQP